MDSDPDSARNLLQHQDSKYPGQGTPSPTSTTATTTPTSSAYTGIKPEPAMGKGYPHHSGPVYGADSHLKLQRKVARLTSYLYGLAIVVVVGGVILIAIIATLYAKLYYDLGHHTHQPKVGEQVSKILDGGELCVPCSEVRLGPSQDEDNMLNVFSKRDSKDGQKCCVEKPAELLRLLELYIEKRYRQEMAKGNIKMRQTASNSDGTSEQKPAAHLMGYNMRQDVNQAPGRQFPIGMWIHEEDLAFINHVTYRHGRIVVPDDGIYYVYSQVAFLEVITGSSSSNGGGSSTYGTDSPSLSHYLYRYNIIYPNGGEEKLVQNSITKCWGSNRSFGEYTSYLGAVFHLRQGDEVFVKVSNLTMLARNPKSNYFGLFKV